jgi:hypothetical protein
VNRETAGRIISPDEVGSAPLDGGSAPLHAVENKPHRTAKPVDRRIAALRRFAMAITALNLVGRAFFGFEQSWAQMAVCLVTAHGLEMLLEWVGATVDRRRLQFLGGGVVGFVDFFLPAHITGLAVSMLLYASDRYLPFAFATAVAIGAKTLLTAPTPRGRRHFMNPSNFGLAVTFLVLAETAVGVVPYHFTAHLTGAGDWLLPLVIICTGSLLNAKLTGKMPLIAAWVGGFILQALIRHFLLGAALLPALTPMTGVPFILFSFYMVPDPGTTPVAPRRQMLFGLSVALTYGALVTLHITFALFFALALVCLGRGVAMYAMHASAAVSAAMVKARPVEGGVTAG